MLYSVCGNERNKLKPGREKESYAMIYSPATLMTSEFSHITELVCYFKNDLIFLYSLQDTNGV